MKAVMYGGGNIGRGFIGALFAQSGYEVTFIDVAEPVIKALQEKHRYPVRYVSSNGYEDRWIERVTAVNGNDQDAAAEAIADCDIMATAVGARILKFIVPNLVSGLRKRWAQTDRPLNIVICENLMDANKVLEGLLKAQLTEAECRKFEETVGLVEASIGRMVPVQTDEMKAGEPMRVCVEGYGFLPVDKAAFKGEIPKIQNMVPFAPFDFYIKRKLFVHNMGHATCAYLGGLLDLEYIYQAIDVPDVRIIVQNAMLESAMALTKKYGASGEELQRHVTDLLYRFTNASLKDTCQRVGGDPARKLGPDDRMIGSSKLAVSVGITPVYIAIGAAAGLVRYLREADMDCTAENAVRVLTEVSQLEPDAPLTKLIVDNFAQIVQGCTIADLRRSAEQRKHDSQGAVI